MIRAIVGGIVGGIVMFAWGAFSHMVLPLGHMGIGHITDDTAVTAALKSSIHEPGVYFVPSLDMKNATEAEQEAWKVKEEAGPNAFIVYHPDGAPVLAPRQLITELVSNIAAAFVASLILTSVMAGYFVRVVIVALMGLFAALSITASQWNWYRFPDEFACAELVDQTAGWLIAGLAIAAIVCGCRRRLQAA